MLDSKKIKTRLTEILREDQLRRSDTSFFDASRPKKQKNVREYLHKTFMKKKDKSDGAPAARERMEIVGPEESNIHSFKIKELNVRRKGSPYMQKSPPLLETKWDQRH